MEEDKIQNKKNGNRTQIKSANALKVGMCSQKCTGGRKNMWLEKLQNLHG